MQKRVKFSRDYCKWCGRLQFLMPHEQVCGGCIEDPDYVDIQASNKRIERLASKKKGK